ncbi:MAG: flagellar basal body rod protein FlgB [Proteobacteria bacterium]|nr:flagellar basal body rod protein FlgB [Pseudomonadota bacterium]
MDLSKIPLFAQLKGKMDWLTQRQRVLAENIANADTPGYVPKDLKPIDFSRQVAAAERKLKVASTRSGHIRPKISNAQFRSNEQRDPYEVAPAGNAVVLEEQMIKVAETQIDYQLMTSIYKKNLGFFKMALGKRS